MYRPKEMGNPSVLEKSQKTSAVYNKHRSFVTMNVQPDWFSFIGMSCEAQLSLTISHEAGCLLRTGWLGKLLDKLFV